MGEFICVETFFHEKRHVQFLVVPADVHENAGAGGDGNVRDPFVNLHLVVLKHGKGVQTDDAEQIPAGESQPQRPARPAR